MSKLKQTQQYLQEILAYALFRMLADMDIFVRTHSDLSCVYDREFYLNFVLRRFVVRRQLLESNMHVAILGTAHISKHPRLAKL